MSTPSTRGISYPFSIVNGNLATSTDYELISQQIRSVVETRFFERVMRADYGVNEHAMEILDPGLINSEFQTAIQDYVRGLTSLTVLGDWVTEGEDGVYKLFIPYSVDGIPQPPVQFTLAN